MLSAPALREIDAARLFDIAPNPYVILDRDFVIVGMNAAYLAATGRTREALIGRSMFDAFPSDPTSAHGRMLRASLHKALATGEADHLPLIPYPIADQNGAMREYYWSATHTPVRDASGEIAFVLQHTVDVTELHNLRKGAADPAMTVESDIMRRAGEAHDRILRLDAEHEHLRSLFQQAPGFMAVLSGPDHVFTLANEAYLDLVGARDLIGKPVREAMPDIEGQGFFERLDEVYAQGRAFTASAAPVLLRRRDGAPPEERFVDLVYQPVTDANGAPVGIFVQGHDITDQQRAREAARKSEERFRTLAQSMPNQVWTATVDGHVDWFNDRVYEYAGVGADEANPLNWLDLVHPEDKNAALMAWREAVRGGDPYQVEFRLRRHDGDYRWHIARAIAQKDARDRPLRWVGSNTDIDDQKRTEEALEYLNAHLEERVAERTGELLHTQEALRQSQKMEAIGNLAGGIAHDFNNLLQVISGNLQLIAGAVKADPKASERATSAIDAARRGAQLTAQLLAFGRRQPLAPRAVDLRGLIAGMDDILRRTLGEGIEVETRLEDGLWNTLADPVNVENALLNLVINARDAMDGHGRLVIEAANAPAGADDPDLAAGEYVMVKVSDTGSGMSEAIMQKVFEPFFTTKPEGKGTGLGLSMVYGFAKQSGGHVRIESAPGEGATVRLYLPRTTEQAVAAPPAPGEATGGTETILIAEDDAAVRETAVGLLEGLGYTVLAAPSGDAALEMIDRGARPALLFTDILMPGKARGGELARLARERVAGLPVLYTSGYAQNVIMRDGRLEEGVTLLSKPFTREALAQAVRRTLDEARGGKPGSDRSGSNETGAEKPASLDGLDVLLVEDEPLIRMSTAATLEEAGLIVIEAGSGREALDALAGRKRPPALMIADLGLPDMGGTELAREIRRAHPALPIIFATGRSADPDAQSLDRAILLPKPYDDEALIRSVKTMVLDR